MELKRVIDFLERLDAARIHYRLENVRTDGLAVDIAVPGERWEVEFLTDGEVQVEVFRSDGAIADESSIDVLFERFSDQS